MNKKKTILILAVLSCLTSYAMAYEQGEIIARGGIVLQEPREDSDPLVLTLPAVAITAPLDTATGTKTGIGVDNEFTVAGTVSYMFRDNWGLELVLGLPAEFTIPAKGLQGLGVTEIGTTDVIPVLVSLQHYFQLNDERWQPYVGVGLHYTVLSGEEVSDELEESLLAASEDLEFDNDFSFTLSGGVDFKLDDKWLVNAAIYYVDLETDAELEFTNSASIGFVATGSPTPPLSGTIDTTVEVPTWAYFLTVGYRF